MYQCTNLKIGQFEDLKMKLMIYDWILRFNILTGFQSQFFRYVSNFLNQAFMTYSPDLVYHDIRVFL